MPLASLQPTASRPLESGACRREGLWIGAGARADTANFMQGAYCMFNLLVVQRVYSKSEFRVRLGEVSNQFESNLINMS